MKKFLIALSALAVLGFFASPASAGLLNCSVSGVARKTGKITIKNTTGKKVVWLVSLGAPNKGSVDAKKTKTVSVGRGPERFGITVQYSKGVGVCVKTIRRGQTIRIYR